jgi:hypothetical protein
MFATDWFLVLFATSLPSETAARVWDCLFLEGPKVLFRVALALLEMHAPLLMRKDNAGGWVGWGGGRMGGVGRGGRAARSFLFLALRTKTKAPFRSSARLLLN